MSDTTNLRVSISATDTASASIKRVNAEIVGLERAAQDAAARSAAATANSNDIVAASFKKVEASIREEIATLKQSVAAHGQAAAAIKATTAATNEAAASSSILSREMRHVVGLFDSIARGQRGQAMSSIGAGMRDAGLGVTALSTSLIGLVAIMGGAAILRGAEAMGKWATETRAAAIATGMSISQYSSLQAVLTSTGLRAQEADASMRKLSLSLSEALADKTSLAAEAFHNLGISQEMLIKNGQDVFGAMHLIADALRNTEGGANQAKNAEELLGRGLEHLIPLLQNGSAALDQNIEKQKEFGRILTEETAKKLEEVESHVRDLTDEVEGKGIQAFVSWGPAIEKSADALRNLLNVLSSVASAAGTVISAVATSGDELQKLIEKQGKGKVPGFTTPTLFGLPTTVSALFGGRSMLSEDITKYFQGKSPGETKEGIIPEAADALRDRMRGKTAVPPLTTPVSQEAQRNLQMATAEAAASKGGSRTAELQAGIKVLQEWIAKDKEGSKEMIADRTALASKQKELNNELASAGKTAAKQSYADYAASEELILAKARGNSAEIKAIYDDWINTAISKYHQLGKVVDQLKAKELEAVNAAKRGEIMQRVKTDEQAATLKDLNDRLAAFQSGTAPVRGQKLGPTGDIEQAQKYIAQAQQVDAAYREQTASLKQYGATAEQVVALETQAKSKEVALYEKAAEASQRAAEKITEPFTKLFDNIGSEFEGLTSSILSAVISPQITLLKEGLTTKRISESGNQIGAAFRKMLLDGINSAANTVQTALSHMLANALSGGAANTLGELLSQKLTQGLTAIFPSLAGSLSGAAGAAGTAGATTAATTALGAFTTTLGGATAALTGHTGATAINTASTTTNTASTAINTVGTTANTTATTPNTLSTLANTIATDASTVAEWASNAAHVIGTFLGFSSGGIVPSAAGGMIAGGTGGTLAMFHEREMVLPAPISMGLQAMIQKNTGGGGPTNTASLNYAPTINTGSRSRGGTGMSRGEFSQLLALHSGAMLGEARNMMRNGWRP